jgi:hypothetical protein
VDSSNGRLKGGVYKIMISKRLLIIASLMFNIIEYIFWFNFIIYHQLVGLIQFRAIVIYTLHGHKLRFLKELKAQSEQ